ncbi:MAG: DUF177 domain-containing protein [Myxococcales bacterium]|nr:DUF177 domain-containing protein [Myxococcales bacterium]
MKIRLDRLQESPASFSFGGDAAWWHSAFATESGLAGVLAEPAQLFCRAQRIGDDIQLEGGVGGVVELECGRCLARYRHRFSEEFRFVLEPARNRVPADPEGAAALSRDGLCLGDELETGWFRGSEIHLGSIFVEFVSLALPVKPLCREDCPGLCARCGANLAAAGCGCEEIKSDSPFAVLAGIRNDLAPGGK